MDIIKEFPFGTGSYLDAIPSWPSMGKHILASYNDDIIIVYQAYKPSIGIWAVEQQTFIGCPGYSLDRMSWIKPNFLWMMYRSGWASKQNQETILAIALKRHGFEEILRGSKRRGGEADISSEFGLDDVRIQWDPDHDPHGQKLERRAIQLGLRGKALQKFVEEWVVSISDITEFVKKQGRFVQSNQLDLLQVPLERVYNLNNENLKKHVDLDDFNA